MNADSFRCLLVLLPFPVAALSNMWVCGRWLAGFEFRLGNGCPSNSIYTVRPTNALCEICLSYVIHCRHVSISVAAIIRVIYKTTKSLNRLLKYVNETLFLVSVVCCQVEVNATGWSFVQGVLPSVCVSLIMVRYNDNPEQLQIAGRRSQNKKWINEERNNND
jgi:hypothetical protein